MPVSLSCSLIPPLSTKFSQIDLVDSPVYKFYLVSLDMLYDKTIKLKLVWNNTLTKPLAAAFMNKILITLHMRNDSDDDKLL